jgi:deazaflavin-dependent oxidoreductase (nitroreductase family)
VNKMATTLIQAFNPLAMPVARSGLIPIWAIVRHRGRRSGQTYETPVAISATPDGFILPLPFGSKTDWCRNVIAAGGGTIRWRGHDIEVTTPRILDAAAAAPSFPAVSRRAIRAFGMKTFLQLRRADALTPLPGVRERSA